MATATETQVRAQLPNDIENQPSSSEITDVLGDAEAKVAEYEDLSDGEVERAEKYYAAYLLVDLKYQKPIESTEAGLDAVHAKDPAEKLRQRFLDVVGGHTMKVL